jgi:uncharacterized membrane protein
MDAVWNALLETWSELSPATQTTLIAWVLAMVLMPILLWTRGERVVLWTTLAGVTLQAIAVVTIMGEAWGWGRTALTACAVMGMGWAVEFTGSRTGIPFGRYHYTARLQPQLGRVPLAIPMAWLMMLPPAWGVGAAISGERGLAFVVLSALAFTAWDLFLDPQMVGLGFWVWEQKGGYFGIPWVNFLGWALAAGLMTAVVRPAPLPLGPLHLIYAITWLLETIGLAIFWGQPRPALVGFLGMGAMLAWAWLQ